jgi:hypothetical protein
VKLVQRYRRRLKGDGLVESWPLDASPPEELAQRVTYVGSGEHKTRPVDASYDFSPALRSDASRCDPSVTREQAEQALREAIRRQCVSSSFVGPFPQYVWGWFNGQPHVARLTNPERGAYKAWPISRSELPTDREHRLAPADEGV